MVRRVKIVIAFSKFFENYDSDVTFCHLGQIPAYKRLLASPAYPCPLGAQSSPISVAESPWRVCGLGIENMRVFQLLKHPGGCVIRYIKHEGVLGAETP